MSARIIQSAKNWQDFVDALAPLGKKQRGDAFELLTELFLQIHPIYRSKLRHVWHESNLPSNIRNKLNLPSPEIGVDLVAEDTSGGYWAIQCKYHHNPSQNLAKNELNSFLDVATRVCRGKFKTLLAVTSAHGYSTHLHKFAPEVQYLLSDTFQGLDEEFFNQARALIKHQTPTIKPRTPRPHQGTAIQNAIEHFVENDESRGKLIHPCGTGKSLIGYWIADALDAESIIVAVPSLYLVRQTLADWAKESLALRKSMDWMVVCSEDTIGDSKDPAMRFQEIGVDVTTDVRRVADFLRRQSRGRKVVFTTYQSGLVTAEAARITDHIFDVGILDEAHRTVGPKDSLFSHLLDDQDIVIGKRIFMTATERRYQGSSDTILSMDDIESYGDTFDLMTFKEALDQEDPILCDYKIVTMIIGRSEVQQLVDQNFLVKPDRGKWDDETQARTLAALIALRKVMQSHHANHALTFHNSIAKAKAFRQSQCRFNGLVEGFDNVDCFHVSSKVSTGERKAELDRFRDSRNALVTNARCLTEGVDVPTIDAVLFAETKRSTIDIVQAAGRALRPAEGKHRGYIVVPVLADEDDPDAADKAFQDILMTLRAMASNDNRIIDYFRSVSEGEKPSISDSPVEFHVPDAIQIKLEGFIESIETQTWHRLAKLSWMPFEQARTFVHSLNLKSQKGWGKYCRGDIPGLPPRPRDLPTDPSRVYKNKGWQSFGDWLGTGTVAHRLRRFRPFDEAREFARSLNLRSGAEWTKYCLGEMPELPPRPNDIPAGPGNIYKNKGWQSMGDWLGTGIVAPRLRQFRRFEEARDFVCSLKLKTQADWTRYCRGEIPGLPPRPNDIPAGPWNIYKDKGWQNWGDWLGTETVATQLREFRSYEEARDFARSLNLNSQKDWKRYCRGKMPELPPRPDDIPVNPSETLKHKGWISWSDWLGTGTVWSGFRQFRPFEEAREFVHSLRLKNQAEWHRYSKGELKGLPPRPADVPSAPSRTYAGKGWQGYGDWLGTGTAANAERVFRSFVDAKQFVQSLNLKNRDQWRKYCHGELKGLPPKPDDIPAAPWRVYKDGGWISEGDWLGTNKGSRRCREFRSFESARRFVWSLGLRVSSDWWTYCKGEMPDLPPKPHDIPSNPNHTYRKKGWISWPDWLGTNK